MFVLLFLAALCSISNAAPVRAHFHYSQAVGSVSGTSFALQGGDRITGIRVWARSNAFISGIQLRHGNVWAPRVGNTVGHKNEIELFDGEVIVQVSGEYSSYIYTLIFVTSRGRSLIMGQPTTYAFNFYPNHANDELILLSGTVNSAGITSLGAHWGSRNTVATAS